MKDNEPTALGGGAEGKVRVMLRKTDFGASLSPYEYAILLLYSQGLLNEQGEELFDKLFLEVLTDSHKIDWFHDIVGLTIDPIGNVYWQGQVVDYFDPDWAYSPIGRYSAERLVAEVGGEPK